MTENQTPYLFKGKRVLVDFPGTGRAKQGTVEHAYSSGIVRVKLDDGLVWIGPTSQLSNPENESYGGGTDIEEPGQRPLTYEDVLNLLGVKSLPGDENDRQKLVRWTSELLKKNGETWIRENRQLLLDQLDYLSTL